MSQRTRATGPDLGSTDLFDPVQLGPYKLANRIVMAPLTRSRADDAGVPGELQAAYYSQRASAGLIVTEATNISAQGKGYILTPGIWTKEQVAGWKLTTKAVHDKGGRIFLQLWHVGRVSHPDIQLGGALPVAPSAVRAEESASLHLRGFQAARDAARTRDAGNSRHRRGLRTRRAVRQGRGLRRRRDPFGERLSPAAVPRPTRPTSARTATAGRSRTARGSWSR